MNNYIAPGVTRPWLNNSGGAVASGDVVVDGQTLGIAAVDIANGETGEVQYSGRFSVPKVSAAVIAGGDPVIWDVSASEFDDKLATPAAGDVSNGAKAVGAWGAATTTMEIQLADHIGTVT